MWRFAIRDVHARLSLQYSNTPSLRFRLHVRLPESVDLSETYPACTSAVVEVVLSPAIACRMLVSAWTFFSS